MTVRTSEHVQLQVLGPLRVLGEGGRPDRSLVTQPRRLAVMVYLAVARPRGPHARDTLVALLWPDLDDARARHALRNALHALRRSLGDAAIVSDGDGLVALDPSLVRCDAVDLEVAAAQGASQRVLELYAGEFLQGFHVSGAAEFEAWLESERRRLRQLAREAAASLADSLHSKGDYAGALAAARRGLQLEPDSETEMRRVLTLALPAGERSTVLRTYEEFVGRMRAELDASPSAETERAAAELRRAGEPVSQAPPPLAPEVRSTPRIVPHANEELEADAASDPRDEPVRDTVVPTIARRHGRLRGLALGGLALAVAVGVTQPGTFLHRASRTSMREAMNAESQRNVVALGLRLPARWRADTALLDRYLRAEANIRFDHITAARESLRVLTIDAPLYAPGWSGLSHAISLSGFVDIPPRDAAAISRATALRAEALDSTLVENQYALIAYEMFNNWNLPATRARLDSALARYPDDAELANILAAWQRWNGRLDEAVAMKRRALAIDPTSVFYAEQVAWNLYLSHRCDEAAERYRSEAVAYDAAASAYMALYRALRCVGRDADAIDALQHSLRVGRNADSTLFSSARTPAAREAARRAYFRAQLERQLVARRQGWLPASWIALGYAELGEADSTMAWLDSMYVERSWGLHTVPFDPTFDFLREDPRFTRFVQMLPWKPSLRFADPALARHAHQVSRPLTTALSPVY